MPETPRRRWPLPAIIGGIVLLAVVVGVTITIAQPPGRQTAGRPTVQPTTAPPATTGPAAEPTPDTTTAQPRQLTDGIYTVGADIPAGTYTTTAGPHACYWARLRSFGQADSVIDDANLEPGESARVVVRSSDRGFKVSNGCTWRSVL